MIDPDKLKKALAHAQKLGASYADIRYVSARSEEVKVKNRIVNAIRRSEESGAGLRALADGAWGFAASADLSGRSLLGLAEKAVALARASSLISREPVELAERPAYQGSYRTPVKTDPEDVPLREKIDVLNSACGEMCIAPEIATTEASLAWQKQEKLFVDTEGGEILQHLTECGAGISATAVGWGDVQRRSYPTSFGGNFAGAGFEFIRGMPLKENAAAVAREALTLLSAPACPSAVTDLILDSSQLALQVHESCGHPAELDRVLGMEAGYAGTSFLTPEKLGAYVYGSPVVNITADATLPGGLGTFGYDDEGVPAAHFMLIKDGIFCGYLASRETAPKIGTASNGCMRASGWQFIPLVRMTNINLEPGDWTLDEIIRDTREGLFLATNTSWSIDDKRLNFQFATEAAYEINNGSIGRLYKNPTYAGKTPEFWRSCDAIAGKAEWVMWGIPACGKGEPCQIAHVGHGASPARFRQVRVGIR